MNRIEDYINIKELIEKTNDSMNIKYDDMFEYITESGDKCGGAVPSLFEKRMLKVAKQLYPELELVHPANDCELGDIYSPVIEDGLEVKVCMGWGKNNATKWQQGTIQSHKKKFLFIDTRVIDGKLVIKRAFFGEFSYDKWTIHMNKDMRIGPKKVKKYCKQII